MAIEDYPYSFNPQLVLYGETGDLAASASVTLREAPDGPALPIADLLGNPIGSTLATSGRGVLPAHRSTYPRPLVDGGDSVRLVEIATEIMDPSWLRNAIDARDFGFRSAGTSFDNLSAAQSAANAARDQNLPLLLPPDDFWWAGELQVYTDVICRGRMIWSTDAPSRLTIRPTLAPVTINPLAVGPMTRGTQRITGYTGPVGTLEIRSAERLIRRDLGVTAGEYFKRETVLIDRDGWISPPLAHTYAKAMIETMRVLPEEAPVTVSDLRIHTIGTVDAATGDTTRQVQVERSHTTFDRLHAVNTSGRELVACVQSIGCADLAFNNPVISGYNRAGTGYGLNLNTTSLVAINDPAITNCRHGVTTTNCHRVAITGGVCAEPDAHWTDVMSITRSLIATTQDRPVFSVAGSDITVTDCHAVGGRTLVAIRGDSPEVRGRIVVTGTIWEPNAAGENAWIVGGTSYNYSTPFDYQRTLEQPAIEIRDVVVDVRSSPNVPARVLAVALPPRQYPRTQSDITVDGLTIKGGPEVFGVFYDADPATHTGPAPRIEIKRVRDALRAAYIFVNTDGVAAAVRLLVEDCGLTRLQLAEWAMRGGSVVVRGSTVKENVRVTPTVALPDQTGQPSHVFEHCTFDAPAFNGFWQGVFHGSEWRGAVSNANTSVDGRCRAITGGILRAIGATGAPTHPDGYKNATYYT